jgi:hypothetical protein
LCSHPQGSHIRYQCKINPLCEMFGGDCKPNITCAPGHCCARLTCCKTTYTITVARFIGPQAPFIAQGPGSRDMIYQETRYRPRGLLIRIPIRGGYPGTACSVGSRTCVYSICGFILKKAYLSILVINIAKYIATYIDLSHQQGNFKLHPTLAILWHITSRVQGSQGIWY